MDAIVKGCDGTEVRVIEYELTDANRHSGEKVHRLLTTLVDARKYPAEELVVQYHER